MPLVLKHPVIKECHLPRSDELYQVTDEPTRISVRQATQRDHERRAQLFQNIIREMGKDDEVVRLVQRFSFEELKRIEVYLTLAGCNMKDEDGNPVFEFDSKGRLKSEASFNDAWGRLYPVIAQEIHDRVLEVNVDWAPQGE